MPYRRDNLTTIPDSGTPYWIRTIVADGCHNFMLGGIPDERQGILSYRNESKIIPRTARGNFSIACRDENFEQLVPYKPWTVDLKGVGNGSDTPFRHPFEVGIDEPKPPEGRPLQSDHFLRWSMGKKPMFLNFSDPTINNLRKNASQFSPEKVVIPEDYPDGEWVYMIITGNMTSKYNQTTSEYNNTAFARKFTPSAHPVSQTSHPPPL